MKAVFWILVLWHGANGFFMVVSGATWFQSVPGASDTGPYNPHLVVDVGIAFLAAASGLALAARNPAALLPAAVFLGGHALLHLYEMIAHQAPAMAVLRDSLTILVPGFAPALLCLSMTARKEETIR